MVESPRGHKVLQAEDLAVLTTCVQVQRMWDSSWSLKEVRLRQTKQQWERIMYKHSVKSWLRGFPRGAVVKNPPANAGDPGSSPGRGRSHMLRSN